MRCDKAPGHLSRTRVTRRELIKRTTVLWIGTTVAALPWGSPARAEPRKGGNLKIGIDAASTSDSIDPTSLENSMPVLVSYQIRNALIELNTKGQLVPELAEQWEGSEDGKKWVLKLRSGVTFHDGKEFGAGDVVYSLNRHRGKDSKSGAAAYLADVTDIRATDKREVTITLASGNADLPYILTEYHFTIQPEGSAGGSKVGTGPYQLENFQPGIRALGKRNPNYWKEGRAWVDSVETFAITDVVARTSAVQSGTIHVMNSADPKTANLLKSSGKVNIVSAHGGGLYSFPMRCDTPPFDNNDLRLALKYAIDREALVKRILRGYGSVGNDHPIPSFDPMFPTDLPQRPYDPDKAAFHFKKSGYTGSIELHVSDAAFPGAVDAVTLYREHAARARIPIEIKREPSDGYWSKVWMQAPFCVSYWLGRPTANLLLSVTYKSDAPWNESHWKNPSFDKLLAESRAESDVARRKQMYHDMAQMLSDTGGTIIPVFNDFVDAARTNVMGFEASSVLPLSGYRISERSWLQS
jgi:peptide/nickel transport system substrate-binding protein